MNKDTLDTILTALHERRNRLIQLDLDHKVNEASVSKLRGRISDCNRAIREVKRAQQDMQEVLR